MYNYSMGIADAIGLTKKITRPRLEAFLAKYATDKKTLDIGCGNAMYGKYFPNRVTLDREARPGVQVDIIADAHDLSTIESASFDVVLCTEVLEHLHTPAKAIAEFHRILAPGGLLVLSTRFVYPLHDVPGDYYRYTKYGLQHLLSAFDIEELTEDTNTIETLAVLCQRVGFQCNTLGLKPLKIFWFAQAKILQFFSGVLSKEYGDIGHTQVEQNIMAAGYFVAARRV